MLTEQMPTVPPNRELREGDVPVRKPPPPPPDSRDPGCDVTAAPRYRIVTNGAVFKAQRRGWFLWHDIENSWFAGRGVRAVTEFKSESEADGALNEFIAHDRERRGGWRIVRHRC